MRFPLRIAAVIVVCGACAFALRSDAESPESAATTQVKQAAFTHAASEDAGSQSIRFERQPARLGDRIEQNVQLEMRMKLTMRRENELVGNNQTTVRTKQRRIIVATAVESGTIMAARVQYPEATKQASAADGVAKNGEVSAEYQPVAQPVQGKTYLCQREPGENGKLIVTNEAGDRPTAEEYDIVVAQMDMIGRPNPLAQFLAGREVKVGESFELPKELASRVFNLGDKFGEVTHFELRLQKIAVEDGGKCAEFSANVEAAASGASQMRLQVEGPLVVQAETCRAKRVDLDGPIGMSETRGSYSTSYQVIGTGHLKTGVTASYREVPHE